MTKEKKIQYRKAYVELNEVIKLIPEEQRRKIPNNIIDNLVKNMDTSYYFKIDKSKGIFEQDLSIETQALLVEIYEKYLASENEKGLWKKYDNICLNKIDKKRREKYNPDNIFKDTNHLSNIDKDITRTNNYMIEHKDTIFRKFMDKIKKFLNLKSEKIIKKNNKN